VEFIDGLWIVRMRTVYVDELTEGELDIAGPGGHI